MALTEALPEEQLPTSYEIDASVPRIENSATVASATAALDILAGASNAEAIVIGDVYVWNVEDSAENIVAAVESGAVTGADEVRVSFEEGDLLTVAQSEALATLTNLVGDLPQVDQEGAILAGLQTLEIAQNAEAAFLNANADNELLKDTAAIKGVAADKEPTTAEVATAIGQADTAADAAVVTAENYVLDEQNTLSAARAETFTAYATTEATGAHDGAADTDTDGDGITEDGVKALYALDSVATDTRMSDANLAAATEAQADVAADETIYASNGTALAAGTKALTAVYEIADANDVALDVTADYAGRAQVSAQEFTFTTPVDTNTRTITVTPDGGDAIAFVSTYDGSDWSTFTNADGNTAYAFDDTTPAAVDITGPKGVEFTVTAAADLNSGTASAPAATLTFMQRLVMLMRLKPRCLATLDGVIGVTSITDGVVVQDGGEALLGEGSATDFDNSVYAAAELQTANCKLLSPPPSKP